MSTTRAHVQRPDIVVGLLLMGATVAYLTSLPHNLGLTDEANFIYQAKRLADGEVMYRDVFDLITPLSMYLTALVFRIFGADMSVARATIAVVHATIVVCIYACSRMTGVRWSLAAAAALAHLAIAQPTWGFVSQHWFATAATVLVLLSALRCRWRDDPRWTALPGALTGIVIAVQQQKGVPVLAGMGVLILSTHLLQRRAHGDRSWRIPVAQVTYFVVGLVLVIVPPLLLLIAAAGIEPIVRSLIIFPLVNYRGTYRSAWGGVQYFTMHYASFTFPTLLKLAPLSLSTIPVRIGVALRGRSDVDAVQRLVTLAIFALSSIASIAYYPDVIHLAFIAPVFLIVAAEALDWSIRCLPNVRLARVVGAATALTLAGVIGWQLRNNWQRNWHLAPVTYDSAFGRMDFGDDQLIPVIEQARALVAAAPVKEMFCYPSISGPYLWTGAKNPTPYQYFSPTYNDEGQVREILATLEARRTPVVVMSPLMARPGDPIADYVGAHYDIVRFGFLPKMFLYTRRPEATP